MIKTVGSVCSGIEAASVSWKGLGWEFKWFSEIADFPSKVLAHHYPDIPNLGDMNNLPSLLRTEEIEAPDLICGGTPCQAFSFAGFREGLEDDRGNLALKYIDIVEASDEVRLAKDKRRSIVFWENVEGVLTDKTNAFGCLVSYLAGLEAPIERKRWPSAGFIHGTKRNLAWRVMDAKYFGVPQQRKRLYLIAGDTNFFPENILFEEYIGRTAKFPKGTLVFEKEGHSFEVFREYTDCLYAAYGTKWNGNAAANNGSLFVAQDGRLRRLCPLECERLMGFPDNYTDIQGANNTRRFQATGNSWAVPVIKWIGNRIEKGLGDGKSEYSTRLDVYAFYYVPEKGTEAFFIDDDYEKNANRTANCSDAPNDFVPSSMMDIVTSSVGEELYVSPVGCYGILRRKEERHMHINPELEKILIRISSTMSKEEIERRSRIQSRASDHKTWPTKK